MPQLMPLNWVFSSTIIIFLMFSGAMIYSSTSNKILMMEMSKKSSKNLWYW